METTSTARINIPEALYHEDPFALHCALAPVGDLMAEHVLTLDVHQVVSDAAQLLSDRQFRHILVLDGCRLVGVLSDRDILRSSLGSADPHSTAVSAIMTRDPITIRPHASISEAIHLLTSNRVDCLPVIGEGDTVRGIITTTDLLRVSFAVQRWLETRAPRLHA